MVRLTDATPTDLGALTKAIATAVSRGYVVSNGIVERGGRSISAPVHGRSGEVVAAIDISGPSSAFEGLNEAKLIADVQHGARVISARLGAQAK